MSSCLLCLSHVAFSSLQDHSACDQQCIGSVQGQVWVQLPCIPRMGIHSYQQVEEEVIGIDTVFLEGSEALSIGDRRTGRSWVVRPEEAAGHEWEGLKSGRDCAGGPETKGVQQASERRAFAYRSLGHGMCLTMSLNPLMLVYIQV